VGAAFGDFTLTCTRFFPDASYLLVEPLEEYRPFLEAAIRERPKMSLAMVAAGHTNGIAIINVHRDWLGSSMLSESEGPAVDGFPRTVPVHSLDHLQSRYSVPRPVLLKLDVQGGELEVLHGAQCLLTAVDYVWIEVSLLPFFIGGPELHDIVAYMRSHGFVAYDFGNLNYRLLDGALAQADLAFVRADGAFRRRHVYASPAQRAAQDEHLALLRIARMRELARAADDRHSAR
jgi:FkbM family methyltransferase